MNTREKALRPALVFALTETSKNTLLSLLICYVYLTGNFKDYCGILEALARTQVLDEYNQLQRQLTILKYSTDCKAKQAWL